MIASRTRRIVATAARRCAMCRGVIRRGSLVVVLESLGAWGCVVHASAHPQPCPTPAGMRVVPAHRDAA